jgi:DNA replication protein DnaC
MRATPAGESSAPSVGVPTAPPLPEDLETLLRRLRLPHIRRHAPDVVATAKAQRWEPVEVLRALFGEEAAGRERSALATRRAAAGFPTGKTFDAWSPETSSIPAPTQQALRTLEWVHRRENLVVCGPSGTGKTFLLEALGQHAVEQGLKVAWFTLEDLGVLLRRHRADDTVTKAIARVLRADLVVVDDIGLLPVAQDAAEGLYRLVDAAYEKRSIAISSRDRRAPRQDTRHVKPGRVDDQHRQDHEPERDPLAGRTHGAALDRRRDAQRRTLVPQDQGLQADARSHHGLAPKRSPSHHGRRPQNRRSRRVGFTSDRHPSFTELGTSSPLAAAPIGRLSCRT